MKEKTLVGMSEHIRILQKLNESYEDSPTKEAAQKIIDYIDNEIPSQSLDPYDTQDNFAKHLLFGAIIGAILNYFTMKLFELEDSRIIALSAWIVFSALVTYGIRRVEKQSVESSIIRHYLKLKKMQHAQRKQDEIAALEDKYLNASASMQTPS